jgi:hypothetical protein
VSHREGAVVKAENNLMQSFSRQDCINTVLKSPEAVAAKDQQAWLDIFARYSLVEDPVGSAPHVSGAFDRKMGSRGNGPLQRFHSTFIAPYEIIFHVDRDVVAGLLVVRDLTIEIRMSAKVVVHVPMHLVYELIEERGELKIFRLAAHWEMIPSVNQQMSYGWASVTAGLLTGLRMLRFLGLGGAVGFMRAVKSVGEEGKRNVDTFIRFLNGGNTQGLLSLMADGSAVLLSGERVTVTQLVAAGLSVSTGKILSSGNYVSASCRASSSEGELHGVVFFEFNMKDKKLFDVSLYLE